MAALTEVPTGVSVDIAFGTPLVTETAPTVAEVNALTRIECFVDADSTIARTVTGNTTNLASLCDPNTFANPTTRQFDAIQIVYFRYLLGAAGDEAWNLFDDTANPPVTQDLVFCLPGFSGAGTPEIAAVGDKIDIHRGKINVRMPGDIGREDNAVGMVEFIPQQVFYQVAVVA